MQPALGFRSVGNSSFLRMGRTKWHCIYRSILSSNRFFYREPRVQPVFVFHILSNILEGGTKYLLPPHILKVHLTPHVLEILSSTSLNFRNYSNRSEGEGSLEYLFNTCELAVDWQSNPIPEFRRSQILYYDL